MGKPDAVHLRPEVERLASLTRERVASVPLSESHFYETWAIASPEKRSQLAKLMLVVSRRDAIAPLSSVWRREFDAFLADRLGSGSSAPVEIFGAGATYAMHGVEHAYPSDASEADKALTECLVLAEPDRSKTEPKQQAWIAGWDAWAKRYTTLAAEYMAKAANPDPRDRAATAVFALFRNEFIGRAILKEVADEFLELWRSEGSWAIARHMPAIGTFAELIRLRMPQVAKPWKRSDLHDLRYLCVALAYCDRVSCDKWWADLSKRSEYIIDGGVAIVSGAESLQSLIVDL